MLHAIKLLNVAITNEKSEKILEYVFSLIKKGEKKVFITTPNPEILVYASSHLDYENKLNESQVALPDGVGLIIGSYILGKPLRHRITGVDFIEMVCQRSRENPMSIGFLGGRGGVAEKVLERLKIRYPWINIVFVAEEWSDAGFNSAKVNQESGIRNQGKKEIDILFVAFGFPKQEEWIYEHLPHLRVKAAMGVGGAFDYLSGKIPRAPKFVRVIGLEWLFRLIIQPWRFRRQLALITFLILVLKERFTK